MSSRGRKALAENERRRHVVSCRLTDDELDKCQSERGELSEGEWLRMSALSNVPPVIPSLNQSAYSNLARVARNVNQVAKALNNPANRGRPINFDAVLAKISELRIALIEAERSRSRG